MIFLQCVYPVLLCVAILWLVVYTVAIVWLGNSWLKMDEQKGQKQQYVNRFSIHFYCYPNGSVPCSIQDVSCFFPKCEHVYLYHAEIVV